MGELSGIGVGEVVGIGSVALGILAIGYKVFKLMINVIERNARAMEKLSGNVSANTDATNALKDQSASTQATVDVFTKTLIDSQQRK